MRRLLVVILALVFAVILARGLFLTAYRPVISDRYLWGAFHVHSTLSDGLASLDGIAREARKARVSFVLLSDHGAPHPKAALLHETIDGVRFIGGSEVAMPEGHLIISDVDELPRYKLPPFPPDAVEDVAEWGGFSVLTYPEDPMNQWRYWEDDFVPDGMEIINVTSYFRASSSWDKLRWAFFSLFNRNYYLSGLEPPTHALARWDELLTHGPVFAVYAANAHGGFPITENTMLAVPSYATVMGFVGLGVDRRFESAPEEAIRRGEFFAIVRGAGEPETFEFRREGNAVRVVLDVEGLSPHIVLERDGTIVAETDDAELVHSAQAPGVYRAEVYLREHPLLDPGVPWILSNPIYIDVDYPPRTPKTRSCDGVEPVEIGELHVEKDEESTATFDSEGELTYHLSKATETKIDRWVALALRKPMDLSAYRGVVVDAASPETMRYWLELRSGERSYYATFKIPGKIPGKIPRGASRTVVIPWDRFYATLDGRKALPLSEIDALFISVNTSSSRTGFESSLKLSRLGFCR